MELAVLVLAGSGTALATGIGALPVVTDQFAPVAESSLPHVRYLVLRRTAP